MFAPKSIGNKNSNRILINKHFLQLCQKLKKRLLPSSLISLVSFTNDLGADSLDTVELIMELEKEFGVTIPDSDAEKIQTVGDAIAYIENAGK